MSANRPRSTPPVGFQVNGWDHQPQFQPHVPSNYPYHNLQHSYNQSSMGRSKRMSQPNMSYHLRPQSPSSDSGVYTADSYAQIRTVGHSGSMIARRVSMDVNHRQRVASDSSHGQHPKAKGVKIQRKHSLSATERTRLSSGASSLSFQHSQMSYPGSSVDGYSPTSNWETCSAVSTQSDSTQASQMSEPIFKRPRPRHDRHRFRPASAYSQKSLPSMPLEERRAKTPNPMFSRGEAWHMEEEDDESRGARYGRTTDHMDQAIFTNRLNRHYFHSTPHPTPHPPSTLSLPSQTLRHPGGGHHNAVTRTTSYNKAVSPQTMYDPQHGSSYKGEPHSSQRASSSYEYTIDPPEKIAAAIQSRRILSTFNRRSSSPSSHTDTHVPHAHGTHHYVPQPVAQVPFPHYSDPHQTPLIPHSVPPPSTSNGDHQQLNSAKGSPLSKKNRGRAFSLSKLQRKNYNSDPKLNVLATHHHGSESPHMGQLNSQGGLGKGVKGKRVSSPEGQQSSHMLYRHFPSTSAQEGIHDSGSNVEKRDAILSDSEGTLPHRRAARSKSAGSVVLRKIAKKLSRISVKAGRGGGGGGGGGVSEEENPDQERERGSGEKMEKFKRGLMRSSRSTSNLDRAINYPGQRTRSMEQLTVDTSNLDKGVRGFSTPGTTPVGTPQGTPRMNRSWSKTRLGRRGSEPDLEGALSSLFRTGSKKNLLADPSEVLFELIEQSSVEGVQHLLEMNLVTDFNTTNEDDFTPVDLAVMLNHTAIAKMLLAKGAKDSTKFCRDPFTRFSRVVGLLMESERELESLKCELLTQNNSSNMKELEKKLRRWEWRTHLFKKMKYNYEHAAPPAPPTDVTLHVTSNRSLTVTFSEPEETNGATVTRYKIEWCRSEKFAPIVGEFVMMDLRSTEYIIPDLNKGENYFVRVSAYNMKGFGRPQLSTPPSTSPSSWHDVSGSQPRYEGSTDNIHIISAKLNMMLSHSPPPISPPTGHSSGTPALMRARTVKKGISKLFGSTVKFYKTLKAGVYLASLVYSEDSKVLVTVDDQVPIVEVSDSHSSAIGADFVWLAKVACTWENVREMCDISDSYTSSPAVQFRNKLLHAILDLQEALNTQDLGLLHPVPYKDAHGAIVFIITQYLKDVRSLQTGSYLKWVSLPRLWKKRSHPDGGLEGLPVPDQVVLDAQEIIAHHNNSTRTLSRGLYLGYLKARSSVASMKVICSREYPNVLPHIKIRDNPNISREEWEWLKSLKSSPNTSSSSPEQHTSNHTLQKTLLSTIDTFLHNLGISKENAEKHQLYCHEVIELNEDISLLLLLPPPDHVCTAPGSTDHFVNLSDFVPLPINTFEIMQLYTYQRSFMARFSAVSARLDIQLLTSQQRSREAFYKEDVASAKQVQTELENFQDQTEQAWKQMRWIEDALQKGRDVLAGTETLLSVRQLRDAMKSHPPNGLTIKRVPTVQAMHQAGPTSGYLRVFPAYDTGLVRGTSVKLYITFKTTSSEVIRLVVQELEKTRRDKGIPGEALTENDMLDFFLVAVNGTQERLLDSHFYPLQLQIQSSKWRLFVKRRSDEQKQDEQATSV